MQLHQHSNPVALATRTTSPLLQVDPDLSLAWWAIFKPWHASSKSGQMAFPNAKNFLGAGFGFNKAMVLSKASGLLAMVRSLASMSSKTDFSKTWGVSHNGGYLIFMPTHLFFLSMQKQFGRMPCLAKLLAMCNSQWCFLNMCQPHAFHLAKMDSTQIWIFFWCDLLVPSGLHKLYKVVEGFEALYLCGIWSKGGEIVVHQRQSCQKFWSSGSQLVGFLVLFQPFGLEEGHHLEVFPDSGHLPARHPPTQIVPSNSMWIAHGKYNGSCNHYTKGHASNHGRGHVLAGNAPAKMDLPKWHASWNWSCGLFPHLKAFGSLCIFPGQHPGPAGPNLIIAG